MASQVGGLIRDQNLNVRFDVAPLGAKTNVSKAQKNRGLGGRKALNDISNSGRPSTLPKSIQHSSKNVLSVGEDISPSKLISSFGGERNVYKAPEKVQAGGRKALSDLTNSRKPHVHQTSKKSQDKKLSAVAEEQIFPRTIAEEQFLHNHQECIKAQRGKAIDMDYFLKTIGLDNDNCMQLASPCVSPLSGKLKPESPPKYLEMEDMSELLYEDQSQWKKTELPCGSPKSPKPPYMHWKDYNFANFMLTETPKLHEPLDAGII